MRVLRNEKPLFSLLGRQSKALNEHFSFFGLVYN